MGCSPTYSAVVSKFQGSQVGQVAPAGTMVQLANGIYRLIKPPVKPLPDLKVSLGTITLNTFQNSLRAKGITAQYYESLEAPRPGKPDWNPINVSSVSSLSKFYAVRLSKRGYSDTEEIPFRVVSAQGENSNLRFDRVSETLKDGTIIILAVDPGSSGVDPQQVGDPLSRIDSRLVWYSMESVLESIQRCQGPIQCDSIRPTYSVKIQRN
jgi:hypothetical protein